MGWERLLLVVCWLSWSSTGLFVEDREAAHPGLDHEMSQVVDMLFQRSAQRAWKNCSSYPGYWRDGAKRQREFRITDSCFVLPALTQGGRPIIYRHHPKVGSSTMHQMFDHLLKVFNKAPFRDKPQYVQPCGRPEVVAVRKAGALEFALSREPINKIQSCYYYKHRNLNASTGEDGGYPQLVHYLNHVVPKDEDIHCFQQAFFFCNPCQDCGSIEFVLKLENIAKEFPALMAMTFPPDQRSDFLAHMRRVDWTGKAVVNRAKFRPEPDADAWELALHIGETHQSIRAPPPRYPREISTPLCAFLNPDYDLFPWYQRPSFCDTY